MNYRFLVLSTALLASSLANSGLRAQSGAALTVDLKQPKAAVSPMLYGLMTEEINYSYDGGLYAELVRNRTFRSDWTGILDWFLVEKGYASAKVSVDLSLIHISREAGRFGRRDRDRQDRQAGGAVDAVIEPQVGRPDRRVRRQSSHGGGI